MAGKKKEVSLQVGETYPSVFFMNEDYPESKCCKNVACCFSFPLGVRHKPRAMGRDACNQRGDRYVNWLGAAALLWSYWVRQKCWEQHYTTIWIMYRHSVSLSSASRWRVSAVVWALPSCCQSAQENKKWTGRWPVTFCHGTHSKELRFTLK